jgi:3-deoxy-D-manno-octulosonic-acid transferase
MRAAPRLERARRSELPSTPSPARTIVVLTRSASCAQLYQVARRSSSADRLVDQGGHNILEPAVFGKAIVFGPYMQNFAEIARHVRENDAAVQIRSGRELEQVLPWPADRSGPPGAARAAARALVEANRGARGKTMTAIARVLPPQDSGNVRPFRVVH